MAFGVQYFMWIYSINWTRLPIAFGNKLDPRWVPENSTVEEIIVFRNIPNNMILFIQRNTLACQYVAWSNMEQGCHLWLKFWVWRRFTILIGRPSSYKFCKVSDSVYFSGVHTATLDLKQISCKYLCLADATGSHPVWHYLNSPINHSYMY